MAKVQTKNEYGIWLDREFLLDHFMAWIETGDTAPWQADQQIVERIASDIMAHPEDFQHVSMTWPNVYRGYENR